MAAIAKYVGLLKLKRFTLQKAELEGQQSDACHGLETEWSPSYISRHREGKAFIPFH
jgi:hypothetical protein